MSRVLLLLSVLVAPLGASAVPSVQFYFEGVVTESDLGHTVGQPMIVSFSLNNYAPAPVTGGFPQYLERYFWYEESLTDPLLLTDLAFSGGSGTWTRPSTESWSPTTNLAAVWHDQIDVTLGTDSWVGDTGLSVGSQPLKTLSVGGHFDGLSLDLTSLGVLPNPALYFAQYAGTYAALPGLGYGNIDTGTTTLTGRTLFTVNTLTIVAVPEPAHFAVALGLVALLAVIVRRRRAACAH